MYCVQFEKIAELNLDLYCTAIHFYYKVVVNSYFKFYLEI